MYWKLNDEEIKQLKEISLITGVTYELEGNLIPVTKLIYILKDMLCEYHKKEEELEDLKK